MLMNEEHISSNKDINDVFDDILFSEEKLIEDGYKEGYIKGSKDGNPEGYHLGFHRGAELGAELGYYYNTIERHIELHDKNNLYLDKVVKTLLTLKGFIIKFPTENLESVDIIAGFDNIRTLYKKACALLKIDSSYPEIDNLSF